MNDDVYMIDEAMPAEARELLFDTFVEIAESMTKRFPHLKGEALDAKIDEQLCHMLRRVSDTKPAWIWPEYRKG